MNSNKWRAKMDCKECNATMEAEEIKFGWHVFMCPDCEYQCEGSAYEEDLMDGVDTGNWSNETYNRILRDIYDAPDYPRDVIPGK